MPRSDQFEYSGLSVEHAGGIDPREANQRSFNRQQSPEKKGLGPVTGIVSPRKRRVQNPITEQQIDETNKAAQRDWRNKGITNNQIQDY